jgi:hypothetical protein
MGASDMINAAEVATACRIQKIGLEKEAIKVGHRASQIGTRKVRDVFNRLCEPTLALEEKIL